MNSPDQCQNMADIRAEIDCLDRQVIALLGQRYAYVKAAAKFKPSAIAVKAPERLEAMLQQRQAWAETEGLNGEAIAALYRNLVDHFITEEMNHWQQVQPPRGGGQDSSTGPV